VNGDYRPVGENYVKLSANWTRATEVAKCFMLSQNSVQCLYVSQPSGKEKKFRQVIRLQMILLHLFACNNPL
jgi:hypothetical protein